MAKREMCPNPNGDRSVSRKARRMRERLVHGGVRARLDTNGGQERFAQGEANAGALGTWRGGGCARMLGQTPERGYKTSADMASSASRPSALTAVNKAR